MHANCPKSCELCVDPNADDAPKAATPTTWELPALVGTTWEDVDTAKDAMPVTEEDLEHCKVGGTLTTCTCIPSPLSPSPPLPPSPHAHLAR